MEGEKENILYQRSSRIGTVDWLSEKVFGVGFALWRFGL